MREHLPALIVVIPLLAAPLCIVFRRLCPPWIVAFAAALFLFAVAAEVFTVVAAGAELRYAFGGWEPPWGIAFRIDALNAPLAALVAFIAMVVVAYARTSIEKELAVVRRRFFYALLMLCLCGLSGMVVTQDLFNAFVFMEIAALASYALIALSSNKGAPLAAFRYLVVGSVGTTFFLIGVSYMYMLTGTLNYADLSERVYGLEESRTFLAALALIATGLAMKIALFPLHSWLPGAYSMAPSAAAGFFSAVSSKVPLYLLVRLYFDVFKPGMASSGVYLDAVLIALSATAIVYASWRAIRATDVRRMLAFSSVGQIAYITLGVGLATPAGLAAAWIHLFGHALTKSGLFLALGCVLWRRGACRVDDLRGLGASAPWTAAAITVGGAGLVGVPLTAGFVAKWHLVLALVDTPMWWLLAAVLPGSLIAAVYVWRLVEAMYFVKAPGDVVEVRPPPALMVLSWVLIGATIYFGVYADGLTRMAQRAAALL